MRQLRCIEPGRFEYRDVEMPIVPGDHALVRVKRVGICGTDIHAYGGTQPFFVYPRVLGHELSGEVAEVPDSTHFRIGDQVTVIPYFSCGSCIACRKGKPNCCKTISVFGVHEDGGMQEYISVPVSSMIKKEGLTLEQLALAEPLAIGLHGIKRTDIQPGDQILVVGAGPIGLGLAEFARLKGAEVIIMDVNENRLGICKDVFRFPHIVNALNSPSEAIDKITGGERCPAVFDATGSLRAINDGLHYVAHGGAYVLVGLQRERFSFSHPEFHKRETTLMSSRNATKDDFTEVLQLLCDGKIDHSRFITHTLHFDQASKEFPSLSDPNSRVIKAMVYF